MRKAINFIQDIIDIAGSSSKLAAELDIHAYTVERWKNTGVPIRYWNKLYELYGITPAELFVLSRKCRNSVTNPSRCK